MRHAWVVTRRSAVEVPADLRARLEAARLDLLALFRALDRMDLTPSEIPQRLIRQVIELDAAYVECSLGTGSTSRSLEDAGYAPRYPGRSGTITGGLHAIQEESSSERSSPLGPTGSHRSSEPAPGRSLQLGPRLRSPERLSTPTCRCAAQTHTMIFGGVFHRSEGDCVGSRNFIPI